MFCRVDLKYLWWRQSTMGCNASTCLRSFYDTTHMFAIVVSTSSAYEAPLIPNTMNVLLTLRNHPLIPSINAFSFTSRQKFNFSSLRSRRPLQTNKIHPRYPIHNFQPHFLPCQVGTTLAAPVMVMEPTSNKPDFVDNHSSYKANRKGNCNSRT